MVLGKVVVAYKDLQLQILEDVAAVCHPVLDFEEHAGRFLFIRLADHTRHIKRRRPEGMLERLRELIKAKDEWLPEELVLGLGWGDVAGARHSVGLAMQQLGWIRKTRASHYKLQNGKSRPTKWNSYYVKS